MKCGWLGNVEQPDTSTEAEDTVTRRRRSTCPVQRAVEWNEGKGACAIGGGWVSACTCAKALTGWYAVVKHAH